MAEIKQLPIAHLVNPEPLRLRCNTLLDVLETGTGQKPPLTFLDRENNPTPRRYEELLDGAQVVANYLKNRGLRRHDKVLILLITSDDFINAFFGTILAAESRWPPAPR